MRDKSGFTLIELIVTITIMSILLSVGFLSYRTVLKNGRDVKRQADLKTVQSALEQYRSDQGYYPMETEMNSALINGASLTNSIGANTVDKAAIQAGSKPTRTYLNILPQESQTPGYRYQAVSGTYCLFSTLENTPSSTLTTQCNSFPSSSYKLLVTPP